MYQNNSNKISSKECAFITTLGSGIFGTITGGAIGGVASSLAGYSFWIGICTGLGPGCILGCGFSVLVSMVCCGSNQQHQPGDDAAVATPILTPASP